MNSSLVDVEDAMTFHQLKEGYPVATFTTTAHGVVWCAGDAQTQMEKI